jgi:hypothetical protein
VKARTLYWQALRPEKWLFRQALLKFSAQISDGGVSSGAFVFGEVPELIAWP